MRRRFACAAAGAFNGYPKATKYSDFRVMLDKQGKEIDAVVVSTPDHTHAVASITAMKMGKHCYTREAADARRLGSPADA